MNLPAHKVNQLENYAANLTHGKSMAFDVLTFMIAFDQIPRKLSEQISANDFALASKLIQEEVKEMFDGFNKLERSQSLENLVEFADGAIDTIYVILWALLKFNLPADSLFREVQRSNMAKLNADGTYTKNAVGKVQKPATWTAPDLHFVIVQHQDEAQWIKHEGIRK